MVRPGTCLSLISTIVANDVVNSQGITFVSRMASETGAEPAEVARAFWIARAVTGATDKWNDLEALDGQLDPDLQRELMSQADDLVEACARWYLQRLPNAPLGETIAEHAERFAEFERVMPEAGPDTWREQREATAAELAGRGVPEALARRHAYLAELEHGPDAIQVAQSSGRAIADVARAFFLVGDRLHLEILESRLARLPRTTRWQSWAAQAASDDSPARAPAGRRAGARRRRRRAGGRRRRDVHRRAPRGLRATAADWSTSPRPTSRTTSPCSPWPSAASATSWHSLVPAASLSTPIMPRTDRTTASAEPGLRRERTPAMSSPDPAPAPDGTIRA